jgi:hypothetical protein
MARAFRVWCRTCYRVLEEIPPVAHRYYVVGGEYADMSFTVPAPGTQLETHGPFAAEREAKICWRDLTGKTVDNAMVRYFIKSAEDTGGKNYWVVGGEYADSRFTRLAPGKELEVYGPFARDEALGFWRGLAAKSIDDAMMRYDIRENYEAGETGTKIGAASDAAPQAVAAKSIAVAISPEKLFDYLMDGTNWPKWASYTAKAARAKGPNTWVFESIAGPLTVTMKGDRATGVFDHTVSDSSGNSLLIPGRVMPAGGGAAFVLIFTRLPGVSDSQFEADLAHVDEELRALKRTLEG